MRTAKGPDAFDFTQIIENQLNMSRYAANNSSDRDDN
jgi:hypothetical protein